MQVLVPEPKLQESEKIESEEIEWKETESEQSESPNAEGKIGEVGCSKDQPQEEQPNPFGGKISRWADIWRDQAKEFVVESFPST